MVRGVLNDFIADPAIEQIAFEQLQKRVRLSISLLRSLILPRSGTSRGRRNKGNRLDFLSIANCVIGVANPARPLPVLLD